MRTTTGGRIWLLAALLSSSVVACGGASETASAGGPSSSHYGGTYSHRAGENCVGCHRPGRDGVGWFTVAGTVYEPNLSVVNPDTTVRLFTGPGATGTLVGTIEVDALGNFYTTRPIDFSGGLYPVLYGKQDVEYKALVTTSGECSRCHGVGIERLHVE